MAAKRKNRKPPKGGQLHAASRISRSKTQRPARRPEFITDLTRKSVLMGRAQAKQFIKQYSGYEPFILGPRQFLMAKGDSWFNYGRSDILHVLERNYPYTIDAIAATGARIVQVANDGWQLKDFCDEITYQVHGGRIPRAILLSGAGNDIADNFEGFLFQRSSAQRGWNQPLVDGFVNGTIKSAYAKIVSAVDAVCTSLLGHPVPILTHGYARPVPDGRGIFGNWLMDGFVRQGYTDLAERTVLAGNFIDQLNTMQSNLRRDTGIASITYVDLRPALSSGSSYQTYWANELHPTKFGFEEVTKLIAGALSILGIGGQSSLSASHTRVVAERTHARRGSAIR